VEERERGAEAVKIKAVYYVATGLALALTISVCDGLKTQDRYSALAGQLQEALRNAAADSAILNQVIADKDAIIVELDKKLATSAQVIVGLKGSIAGKDKDLAALRESWAGLSAECQTRLRELDVTWSEKFSLLEGVVAEKDKQIAALSGKYDAQVVIGDAWKQKCEGANRLLTISTALNKSLVRKVKTQAIIGNLKTGAVVAAAGWIIFNAIKGK
jgi:hypothetical protein